MRLAGSEDCDIDSTPATADGNRKVAGHVVDRYVDEAVGLLDRTWMSKVTLRPRVTFSGRMPSDEEHLALHHQAHEKCFITNSIKSEVTVEPSIDQR